MPNTAETVSRDTDAVRALVIPLAGIQLVVPNTAIAEVVAYREPTPIPGAAQWMPGKVEWRGLSVPLFAFEVFAGLLPEPPGGSQRLVLFNTLNGNAKLPFVAVASQGIPRSLRITPGSIQQSAPADEPGIACRLGLAEASLAIPDLDAIEHALAQGGVSVTREGA
jgi:chemosensory pili system protein ChpC